MMPSSHHNRIPASTAIGGYGALLEASVAGTTRRVEEMHRTIARVPFRVMRSVPVLGLVARLVERVYDAITGGVYTTVRGGSAVGIATATWAVARHAEAAASPSSGFGGRKAGLRSALNGTHGDFLAATANPLAAEMGFYAGGRHLPLTPDGLRIALPDARDRVCVFVHGICCDESAWRWGGGRGEPAVTYGERLQEALGYTPLYLRYNTGLPIADNGRALAHRMQALADAYPCGLREVVLIGHSMGGLVAHHACATATREKLSWTARTRMVITLGSPFRGSPLAKVGHFTTAALLGLPVTAPLGALADARSTGVKDLRHGLNAHETAVPTGAHVAYRFISASLSPHPQGPLGRLLGDGLVPMESAAPRDLLGGTPAHVGGIGHLDLLNEPRVYAQIARWLTEPT